MEISHKKVLGKGFRSIIGSEISLISLQLCCWITQSLICIQYNSFIDAFHNVFVSILGVGIFLWYCIMLGQGIFLRCFIASEDRIAIMDMQDNSTCARELKDSTFTQTEATDHQSVSHNAGSIDAMDECKNLKLECTKSSLNLKHDAVSVNVQTPDLPEFPRLNKISIESVP
ncbi:hypothetical protein TrispH2_011827 [Trichoplax sp. H2]|nr:hypothetical protein TrispH2_011827 [Trichoplax sp. H2]|eukprot:RDD36072.1 hypothetical protein TrispH2_011827 [Trichoplax sp. H2]